MVCDFRKVECYDKLAGATSILNRHLRNILTSNNLPIFQSSTLPYRLRTGGTGAGVYSTITLLMTATGRPGAA